MFKRAGVIARYATLHREHCIPPWEILEVDYQAAPWSLPGGARFKCPGCDGAVAMRWHGPPWKPSFMPELRGGRLVAC